jgi:hypothetical protein
MERMAKDDSKKSVSRLASLIADFCNKICQKQTCPGVSQAGPLRVDFVAEVGC